MTRPVLAALAILAACCAALAAGGTAGAGTTSATCPAGMTCLTNVVITDENGLGAALEVRDYLGNPMLWADTFQAGSSNPVCAVAIKTATTAYLAREACLGGPPFNATGGHPVLSLWDGRRWQTLTARDIAWIHAQERKTP